MDRRISFLFASLALLLPCFKPNTAAQTAKKIPARPSGPQAVPGHPGWIITPVSLTGMKCDGSTDDSAALQAILNSAVRPGRGNAAVIMPPGVCIISVAAHVSINSPVWLQGAGKIGTKLKRKNYSNEGSILVIHSNGVTLSDFAFDGNKGGPGIRRGADSVSATGPFSDVTIRGMRFANSIDSDIVSSVIGAGSYTMNSVVEDNDFKNQSNPFASCVTSIQCGNIRLLQPPHVQVLRNRSDNS